MKVLWQSKRGRVGYGYRAAVPLSFWWALVFEPRDLWVGAYWVRPDVAWRWALDIYVCPVPMLAVKVSPRWKGWSACWRDLRRVYFERREGRPGPRRS